MAVQTVIMVVYRDKADAKERENPLDIFPRIQVLPAETGQVFDYNTVNFAGFDLGHHFLKCRPLKIGTGETIVHLHAALPQFGMARHKITDQVFLSRDTVAFLLVAVFARQTNITAGIPYLCSVFRHDNLS